MENANTVLVFNLLEFMNFIQLRCAGMSRFWLELNNFHFLAKQEEASVKGTSIWLTCLHHKFRPDFVEAHHLHLHMRVELGTV